MPWVEISITCSSHNSGDVLQVLEIINQNGMVEESRGEDVIYKLYTPEIEFEHFFNNVKCRLSQISFDLSKIAHSSVKDENWAESWKEYFTPVKIGRSIVVKPPWSPYNKEENEHIITIKPAMAFGIGTHETTKMAIALLEKHATRARSMIDFGCGTGIIAISAHIFGVKDVYAIDNDPLSIEAVDENLTLNDMAGKIKILHRDNLEDFRHNVDIIVANIMAPVLINLKKQFSPLLSSGGLLILGGILDFQGEDIVKNFSDEGFEVLEEMKDNEWVSFVMRKI